uniref:Major facilitator superfamily (MFS) profile domain-containing protein n=1 Tax=Entomoneis paludosa TaxID=265537 RepID=A0A7S2Y995_9STRA
MCLAGYFLVYFGVPETLPEEKRREFRIGEVVYSCYRSCCQSIVEIVQSISSWIHPTTEYQSPLSNNEEEHSLENGSINYQPDVQKHIHDDDKPATIRSLWSRPSTRQHMLIYWLYSFLVISVDEVFPLFCISKESGLGIQEQRIGNLLTATGLCYLVMQYVVLTKLVESYGFYKALRIGALCSIPVVCLIPLSLLTNMGAEIGTLTWSSLSFLGLVYATTRVFSSVVFSTITMTTNRTVPSHHRATMNGLSMLGGSLAKAAGPAFAGVLFSVSVGTIPPPYGSVVVYGIISLMGVGLYMQATRLEEPSLDEIEGK